MHDRFQVPQDLGSKMHKSRTSKATLNNSTNLSSSRILQIVRALPLDSRLVTTGNVQKHRTHCGKGLTSSLEGQDDPQQYVHRCKMQYTAERDTFNTST